MGLRKHSTGATVIDRVSITRSIRRVSERRLSDVAKMQLIKHESPSKLCELNESRLFGGKHKERPDTSTVLAALDDRC